MVAFVMMGIVAVIGFLCVSRAITDMVERNPQTPFAYCAASAYRI